MARVLIVGGGCRGRGLAREMVHKGHTVCVTTRTEIGRAVIEEAGAECWIGNPDRLGTLCAALERVTIVCWMLGSAVGSEEQVRALHASRLESFLGRTIDSTVRGLVYEASGTTVPREVQKEGERIVRSIAERNAIPVGFVRADIGDLAGWMADACTAVETLIGEAPA